MKKYIVSILAGTLLLVPQVSYPRHGGAIAGGVLGGLALGGIIGSAASRHRGYYYDPYYYDRGYYNDSYYYGSDSSEARALRDQNYQLKKQLEAQQEQMAAISEKLDALGASTGVARTK